MTRTCLIAEADPFIANLLLRFAEESGLHGVRARTGQEILTLVPAAHPDILIVEPELPGEVRGWEAVRALRAEAEAKAKAKAEVEVDSLLQPQPQPQPQAQPAACNLPSIEPRPASPLHQGSFLAGKKTRSAS